MKRLNLLIILSLVFLQGIAQVVITDPAVPISDMPVTITYDATQGNEELAGYTGEVYAHTGVITNYSSQSSDWRYVKSGWGENTPETKLTRIGDDIYTIDITPSVRDYFGVPQNETIEQMAFVFRSAEPVGSEFLVGRTETGGDIFIDVVEAGLNILFVEPESDPLVLGLNESFNVEVYANEATSVSLYLDNVLLKEVDGNTLYDTITVIDFNTHWVKAVAHDALSSVADSFYYVVRPEIEIANLPDGVRDGINYMADETVVLSLLAPDKEYIYVIGDFNDWRLDNNYFMKMTPNAGRFWVQINGLVPGEEYGFQYFIDGQLRLADPYTDKVLDFNNDPYILEETYPNLKEYPTGKTQGLVSVLQTAQAEYPWEVNSFSPPEPEDMIIYELLIRDFTDAHSYKAVTDSLDYLANLGINVLELMPVNEFEGNSSWGYNPSFYFAPDKYYGPKNELKRLIDECHKRGIAVVLDIVLNHSYDQSPLVQMYFDGNNPLPSNPWYNPQSNFTNPDAQWGNDFNHESLYTQNFVDSVNSYWMSEYRFDGFRFDFTKGFSNTIHGSNDPWGSNYDSDRINILKRMMIQIRARNENAIVILEHLAENSEEKNLADFGMLMWGNLNYNYAEASMGYHDGGKSDFSMISYQKRGWDDPHLVGYMESHDEERVMYKNVTWGNSGGWSYNISDTSVALDRIRLVSSFFYTIPGPKMVWQFGELGYDYSIDFNGRLGEKPVRWDYYDDWRRNYNYNFIAALIDLRKSHEVFRTDDYILNVNSEMKRIRLYDDSMNVVVIGNFDVVEGEMQPLFNHAGSWYDYFSGTTLEVTDVEMSIPLAPGEYRIYTDIQLETPDINTGIGNLNDEKDKFLRGMIYPNPVSGNATLAIGLEHNDRVKVSIYDILGKQVIDLEEKYLLAGQHSIKLDTLSLNSGLYLCVLSTTDSQIPIKFVVE